MTTFRPDPALLKRPMYLSLAEQIGKAIDVGLLEPGERLAPQRELADELGLSLQTVSRAYEELHRKGLVQGEVGRGTYVQPRRRSDQTPFSSGHSSDQSVDLSIYKPVVSQMHAELLQQALAELGSDLPRDVYADFRPIEGQERHKESALTWLRLCGLETRSENVIITNGVTQAMMAAFMAAGKVGGCVATEALGHHAFAGLCSYLGMRYVGLEIDEQGIVPAALGKACRENDISLLFCMPSLANPTVSLMSEERRRALVDIARAHDIRIVEDDVLGPLVPQAPPPLAALAPERTFYLTGFSKCLMPGMRTGYMVVPEGDFRTARSCQLVTAWMATPVIAEIASRWVQDGTAQELVRWQRKELASRNRLASRVMGQRPCHAHPAALHLWLPLPGEWKSEGFVARAREQGIAVAPSAPFVIAAGAEVQAVRISLGSAKAEDLERGLRIVAQITEQQPDLIMDPF